MNNEDFSWAYIHGYYYPKFLIMIKNMLWDERYAFLKSIYNDKNTENLWEERSESPIQDMMEYVARKEYFHFFCMGFTVFEDGRYIVHEQIRELIWKYNNNH